MIALPVRVIGIGRNGRSAWPEYATSETDRLRLKRPASRRATSDEELTARIKSIHEMSDGTYGAPRVRAELADVDGLQVGIRHISRLMRKARIAGVSRRRYCVTTRQGGSPASPDLVERAFKADGPNQLWVADITYAPT